MPTDVDAVRGVSWDAIRSTWVWEKAGAALNNHLADDGVGKKMAELGVSVDSLRAIAVGMKSSSDGSPASVVAAEGSFDREKVSAELAKLNGGEKLTVGGADFYGRNPKELRAEFKKSLEVFLQVCQEKGIEPRRSYSGRFNVRIPPELHERLAITAEAEGKCINTLAREALARCVAQ